MTEPARRRVSEALAGRMTALHLTVTDLAAKADVDPATIRRVLRGHTWPRQGTRRALEHALGWPVDEFARLATDCLATAPCGDLRREFDQRCTGT